MTPSLLSIMILMTAEFLLLVTVARSEDSDIRREVEDETLRHLHHDAHREWPEEFPEDSSVALLALPGSQPIRSQNTYRRRRKRPRPQPPQDELQFPSSAHIEGPEAVVLPYEEQTSHYNPPEAPQNGYSVYEKSVGSIQNIREPETLPFDSQLHHPRPQRRRPNSSRHKQHSQDQSDIPVRVHSPDIRVKTEEDIYQDKNSKPEEHYVNISQDEDDTNANGSSNDDSKSYVEKDNYTYKRNRDEQHKRPHSSIHDNEDTRPKKNSYHESHPAQFHRDNNNAVVSPQDLKALLKQQSGSLSLSELLQQKNLSLADLLKGNRNALSALTGVPNAASSESKTEDIVQDPVPPRQLTSQTNPRRKNQDTGQHQKPLRYSVKQEHISEDHDLESTKHRRLPPVHRPSLRAQPSHNTDRPVKYEIKELGQIELDIKERINKFVPSSPRRLPPPEATIVTETTPTSSTESNELPKSINPEDQFPDALFNIHTEKHSEIQIRNKDEDNLPSITPVTEHNIIINPSVLKPSHKNSPDDDATSKHLTTDHKSAPVPLHVQETSVIDPLQNSPESDTTDQKAVGNNRLRGKYIPRHRISIAQKNSSNKVETTKSGRVRLPPPNLFLSPLRQRVINRTTSTKDMHEGTTMESVLISNTVSQTHETTKAVTFTERTVESAIKQLQSESPEVQHNESFPNGQITNLPAEIISATVEENKDETLHKNSPFQYEPIKSQSQSIQVNSRAKITSARDEILEFLRTDSGSVRLARILASRNMTLAELIEHRERGSSQQHLADIFRESRQTVYQPTEANMSEAHETEPNHGTINNEVKNNVRNIPQENSKGNGIPSIQEMFSFLEESESKPSDHDMNQQTATTSTQEEVNSENQGSEYPEETLQRETQVPDTLPSFQPNPPIDTPHVPALRPSNPSPHSWKISYQQPDTIYSFDPTNPYFNSGRRPIITSRLTTPTSVTSPTNNDAITHNILLLENTGQVREVANTGVRGLKGPIQVHYEEDKQFNVLYREDIEDLKSDSELVTDVKSTFIVSSAILGLAILGFLAIFVVCRWRQKHARRRFVDGIVNARAHSPILKQPEEMNIRRSLSPVMVNTGDLYKRDDSFDGDDDNQDTRSRRYYLWRTIRKTLRYK